MEGRTVEREREPQHLVCFYGEADGLPGDVAAFLAEGLIAGGAAIVVATPEHGAAIEAGLAGAGIDTAGAIADGRLVVLDAAATLDRLLVDGAPDPERFAQTIAPLVAHAGARHGRVRAFGEMVGLLWADGRVAEAGALEDLWNDLLDRCGLDLYCAYPTSLLHDAGAGLAGVARVVHQHNAVVWPECHPSPPDDPASVAGSDEVARLFVPSATAAAAARRFVASTLAAWGAGHLTDDAAVIASELVTNAVVHASSPFRVTVRRTAEGVHLVVDDTDPFLPRAQAQSDDARSGRGLAIVEALSARWGTEPGPDGKRIWAVISPG